MTISIRPAEGSFADLFSGIDPTRPRSGEEVAAIEAGMDGHAVLVFRDVRRTILAGHAPTVDHVEPATRRGEQP